jgi:hypothetical protein
MSYLITSSPIQSTSQPPSFTPVVISPQQPNHTQLLSASAETICELELQEALREAIAKTEHQEANLIDIQSLMVLNGIYVSDIQGQLTAQEEVAKNKKKEGHLVSDGHPRLYTAKQFTEEVRAHTEMVNKKATEKCIRKEKRATRAATMGGYKVAEVAGLVQNKVIREAYKEEVRLWEIERDQANWTSNGQHGRNQC